MGETGIIPIYHSEFYSSHYLLDRLELNHIELMYIRIVKILKAYILQKRHLCIGRYRNSHFKRHPFSARSSHLSLLWI